MRTIVTAALLTLFAVGTAMAENETITLPAKNGDVEFSHKKHQDRLKSCLPCHEKAPGKIVTFGKDYAHKMCKGCHEEGKIGPTKCAECHKKKE